MCVTKLQNNAEGISIDQRKLNLAINYMVAGLGIQCSGLQKQLFDKYPELPIILDMAEKGTLIEFFNETGNQTSNNLAVIIERLHDITGLSEQVLLGERQIQLGIEVNPQLPLAVHLSKLTIRGLYNYIEEERDKAGRPVLQSQLKRRLNRYARIQEVIIQVLESEEKRKNIDKLTGEQIGNANIINNPNPEKAAKKFRQSPLGVNTLGLLTYLIGEGILCFPLCSIYEANKSTKKDQKWYLIDLLRKFYFKTEDECRAELQEVHPDFSESKINELIQKESAAIRREFRQHMGMHIFDNIFSPLKNLYRVDVINGTNRKERAKKSAKNRAQFAANERVLPVQYKDNLYSLNTIIMHILRELHNKNEWERIWGDTRDILSKYKILQYIDAKLPYPLVMDSQKSELLQLLRNIYSSAAEQFDARFYERVKWSTITDEIYYWEDFLEVSLNRLDDDSRMLFSKYYDLLMSNSDSSLQTIELRNIYNDISKLLKKVERIQDHYIPLLKANQRIYDEDPEQWADLMCKSLDLRYGQNGSQQHLDKSVYELNVAKRKIRANAKNAKIAKGTVNDASTKVNKSNNDVDAWIEVEEPYLPWIYEAPQDLSPRSSKGSRSDKKKATKKNAKSKATKT